MPSTEQISWLALVLSAISLAVTLLRRPVGRWLDRPRFSAHAELASTSLAILCSNKGSTPTSVNAVGMWTTDRKNPTLAVAERLPLRIEGHSEERIHIADLTGLAIQGLMRRHQGHELTGLWVRRMGGQVTDVAIAAADLYRLNGGDQGKFTVGKL